MDWFSNCPNSSITSRAGRRWHYSMGWIVGDPFMAHIHQLIDHIIEHQPALADSLALELDDELRASMDESIQQAQAGESFPLIDLLNEL